MLGNEREVVYSILRESKKLSRSPEFKGVYIKLDQTAAQRKRGAELRKELKTRREMGERVRIRQIFHAEQTSVFILSFHISHCF